MRAAHSPALSYRRADFSPLTPGQTRRVDVWLEPISVRIEVRNVLCRLTERKADACAQRHSRPRSSRFRAGTSHQPTNQPTNQPSFAECG